jgi:hypothetical protein
VSTILVVVLNLFRKKSFQVPFIDCNDVIEEIAPTTLDPALCDAVLPRTFVRGPHRTHPQGSDGCRNLQADFGVPVEYQKAMS